MKLQEILDNLAYGELSQLFIGNSNENVPAIPMEQIPRILPSICLGLTELHKRFLLQEGTLNITRTPGRTSYLLNSRFALSNDTSAETDKYISDLDDPFTDNLMKIEKITTDAGVRLVLNDVSDPDAVRVPGPTLFILPETVVANSLVVTYRADHPLIDRTAALASPESTDINLPVSHLEALLLYVASRMTTPLGLSGEFHDGNNYFARFEAACALLKDQGLEVEGDEPNHKLINNGWV